MQIFGILNTKIQEALFTESATLSSGCVTENVQLELHSLSKFTHKKEYNFQEENTSASFASYNWMTLDKSLNPSKSQSHMGLIIVCSSEGCVEE